MTKTPRRPNQRQRTEPFGAADMQRQFGTRLKLLRLAWEAREPGRHAQRDWADALGVKPSTVSRWETGSVAMPIDAVWRIVVTMEATLDYLYLGVVGPRVPVWLATWLRAQPRYRLHSQSEWDAEQAAWRVAFEGRQKPRRQRARPGRKPQRT